MEGSERPLRRQRVAVVGSGISGLTAAHLLARRHEVHLLEAETRLGGHTCTVDVEVEGRPLAVDTGFIVHNRRTYPGFVRLLADLGVATRESPMDFSVSCQATGVEWGSDRLGTVFAQRRNLLRPSFLRMLRDLLRFNRDVRAALDREDRGVTLAGFLEAGGYVPELARHYVLPIAGAIWSAGSGPVGEFPLRAFARFFENHGLLRVREHPPWLVLEGGSRSYLPAIVRPFRSNVRLGAPVRAIRRHADGVTISTPGHPDEAFDQVVLATHSDQALALLADASPAEKDVLGGIAYQENEVVLHTDARLLPSTRRAWASWNAHLPREASVRAAVTYWMNRLQGLPVATAVCVTLNRTREIREESILFETRYHHPVYDAGAFRAQRRHGEISGRRRTHFCGAYWGFGFHEDGVQSALRVCERFGEAP